MASNSDRAKSCCTLERRRLIKDVRSCDYCSTSYEEHHRCLQRASRQSGQRSRTCAFSS